MKNKIALLSLSLVLVLVIFTPVLSILKASFFEFLPFAFVDSSELAFEMKSAGHTYVNDEFEMTVEINKDLAGDSNSAEIDWGDGNVDSYSFQKDKFDATHVYDRPGDFDYTVCLTGGSESNCREMSVSVLPAISEGEKGIFEMKVPEIYTTNLGLGIRVYGYGSNYDINMTSEMEPMIFWGDGSADAAEVIYPDENKKDTFILSAEHEYLEIGDFAVMICAHEYVNYVCGGSTVSVASLLEEETKTEDVDQDVALSSEEEVLVEEIEPDYELEGSISYAEEEDEAVEDIVEVEVPEEGLQAQTEEQTAEEIEFDEATVIQQSVELEEIEENVEEAGESEKIVESDEVLTESIESEQQIEISQPEEIVQVVQSEIPVYGGGSNFYAQSQSVQNNQNIFLSSEDDEVSDNDSDAISYFSDERACGDLPFTDVEAENDSYDNIYDFWCSDIIHGRTAVLFMPEAPVLRSEVSKVVALLFAFVDKDADMELNITSYSDLSIMNPLAYYIQKLTDAGIYAGYPDKTFKPNQDMTVYEIEKTLSKILDEDIDVVEYEDTDTMAREDFLDFVRELYEVFVGSEEAE